MNELIDLPLGIYEKAICFSFSWEEKLLLAKESGYDFLEINIDGEEPRINRLYDRGSAKELCRAILNTGVPVLSMALTANRKYPMGSDDPGVRSKGIEVVKHAIDYALTAGIRIIQLAPYCGGEDQPAELAEKYLQDSIEKCLLYATANCVMLSLEVIDTKIMKSIEQITRFNKKFDSPFLQAYADIGNLNAMGVDAEYDLPIGGKNILGVHIKDSKPHIVRDVPYGEGNVNFKKCFRTLKKMNYNGIFVAEMWCHDNPEFHQYLKKANKFIKTKIGSLD